MIFFKRVKAQCDECGKYHPKGVLILNLGFRNVILSRWVYWGAIRFQGKCYDSWECSECDKKYKKKLKTR